MESVIGLATRGEVVLYLTLVNQEVPLRSKPVYLRTLRSLAGVMERSVSPTSEWKKCSPAEIFIRPLIHLEFMTCPEIDSASQ